MKVWDQGLLGAEAKDPELGRSQDPGTECLAQLGALRASHRHRHLACEAGIMPLRLRAVRSPTFLCPGNGRDEIGTQVHLCPEPMLLSIS